MTDEEYKKILKQFHKLSDRHILVVEIDMPYSDVIKVVALSDKIRKAGNELVGLMRKNYILVRGNTKNGIPGQQNKIVNSKDYLQ